jgi:hypothetical protein
MRQILMAIALLLSSPLVWAEGCKNPENFAALVELIVEKGQPSDFGLILAKNESSGKYYASLVRGDLPELYIAQEMWTRRGRKNLIDQWIMKFTVDDTSVLHKELVEKDHRFVSEKRLSNDGSDAVECKIFRVFLKASPNSE